MMNLTISNQELVRATKRAALSLKDAFTITITPRKDETTGLYLATIGACDGTVMSSVTFYVNVEGSVTESKQFHVGKEFLNMVSTLSPYDASAFCLEISDSSCKISVGKATLTAKLLPEAVMIAPVNMKEEKPMMVSVKSDDFKKAIKKGGFAYSSYDGSLAAARNAICIVPMLTAEGGNAFRILSAETTGKFAAGSHTPVVAEGMNEAWIKEHPAYLLNAPLLQKIVDGITEEQVSLLLFNNQFILREANDFFIIVPNAGAFPVTLGNSLFSTDSERGFSFTVDGKKMTSALEIAMLAEEQENKKVAIELEGNVVKIESAQGNGSTEQDAENVDGAIRIGINGAVLKAVVSHMDKKVSFAGASALTPMIVWSESDLLSRAFIAPCRLDEEESASVNEETA